MNNEIPHVEEANVDPQKPQESPQPKLSFLWGGEFPSVIDLLAILGIFLLSQIAALAITYLLGFGFDWSTYESADPLVRVAAQDQAGKFSLVSYCATMSLTIVGALILRRLRGGKAPIAKFSAVGFNPSILLWGIILLLSISVVMDPLMRYLPSPPPIYGRGWSMVLTLVVIAPFAEEFLCRGLVLEAVRAKRGAWVACIVSALFFGVLHMHPTVAINAVIIGIVLGYIYIRTNSLFAPIMLHAFNNALAFLLVWLGYENLTLWEMVGNKTIYAIIYGVGLVMLIGSFIQIIRQLSLLRLQAEQNEALKESANDTQNEAQSDEEIANKEK
ncbi:MAG: CPBP family intramembrane glutamic endopeptidase [Rikenellaceae bacterium]